jgi:DNA topoisomerase I
MDRKRASFPIAWLTIQQLKAAVKQVSEVVLATDPVREGETVAWHLKEALGIREPKQVV